MIEIFSQLTTEFIAVLTGAISGGFAYLFARRKNIAEAQSNEIDNLSKAVTIWRELAENLERKVDQVISENKSLKGEIQSLEMQVKQLTREVHKENQSRK